jgi:alginate O-acetyltransferase complex protein AlgJ
MNQLQRRPFMKCLAAFLLLAGVAGAGAALAAPPSVIEGQDGWLFPGWERNDGVNRTGLEAGVNLIREAKQLLGARNVGLLVVVVPAKAPFYHARLPAGLKIAPEIDARYADILSMLGKAGVTTFDDRAVLQSVEQGKQTAFYRADYHWTAWAAEATADESARAIRKNWNLPKADGSGTKLGEWTNDRRYGDLATNFMSPEDRKRIGRDTYVVRKQAEGGNSLLESGPAQAHVVGNSFVQPYLGFTQKLSDALGQPVALTWNPGNIGPWKTLLDAVEGQEFNTSKPKVIVWQFNEAQIENTPDSADSWDAKAVMPVSAWRTRLSAALSK